MSSTSRWVVLGSAAAVIVGFFGPWVDLVAAVSGIDGDAGRALVIALLGEMSSDGTISGWELLRAGPEGFWSWLQVVGAPVAALAALGAGLSGDPKRLKPVAVLGGSVALFALIHGLFDWWEWSLLFAAVGAWFVRDRAAMLVAAGLSVAAVVVLHEPAIDFVRVVDWGYWLSVTGALAMIAGGLLHRQR